MIIMKMEYIGASHKNILELIALEVTNKPLINGKIYNIPSNQTALIETLIKSEFFKPVSKKHKKKDKEEE